MSGLRGGVLLHQVGLSLSILPLPEPLPPSHRHSWADALSTIRLPHVKYICPHA